MHSLIDTETMINGSPELVRTIFIDWFRYPQWNPFMTSLSSVKGDLNNPSTANGCCRSTRHAMNEALKREVENFFYFKTKFFEINFLKESSFGHSHAAQHDFLWLAFLGLGFYGSRTPHQTTTPFHTTVLVRQTRTHVGPLPRLQTP